jgi:hypothetical protein
MERRSSCTAPTSENAPASTVAPNTLSASRRLVVVASDFDSSSNLSSFTASYPIFQA